MAGGIPSWVIVRSVPHKTFLIQTEVIISPGKFGSSNLSVYFINSFGFISRTSPPNECSLPVEKLVKVILYCPPALKSNFCVVHKNPLGGIHEAYATGSEKARNIFSGDAVSTLCSVTLLFDMTVCFLVK